MLNCQRESSWWPLFFGGFEFDLWPTKHWSWRLVFQGNRPVLAIQTATIEGAHAASASDSAASSCRLSWSALGLNEPGLTAGPLDFHRGISKRRKKGTICQWWVFHIHVNFTGLQTQTSSMGIWKDKNPPNKRNSNHDGASFKCLFSHGWVGYTVQAWLK